MSELGFRPLLEYPNRCDAISRCRWVSSKFPKCRQKNHYSCYKNKLSIKTLKNRTLQILQTFHTFSKEHYKHSK